MSSRPYDRLLEIVRKQSVLVELAEAPQQTVAAWKKTGNIPLWHVPTILRNAEARGIEIPPEIFFPPEAVA